MIPDGRKAGDQLDVNHQYYREACDCIAEIGIKLGHVIWRKLAPREMENADTDLNETCYQLLASGNYRLAAVILEFAVHVLKKHSTERAKLTFLVNLAQASKWMDDKERCRKLLEPIDWTAKAEEFKIVVHALRDEYTELCALMRHLGANGPIGAADYKDWPIFKECRLRPDFAEAYQAVFQQSLEKIETAFPVREEHIKAFLEKIGGDGNGVPLSGVDFEEMQ